ncbi:hypothetical protein RHMOL_Rhmol01G0199900 [Rhododendron molle]|uniref:Uncharacterized protein n=1 Tax=Rhododendron molle TaxID=49168 RepID=A0ACC0Q331_RHOML|nr:hypothetical protein RHMOL_Rhmol01G0199900 [Rhododendron molle]
MDDRGGGSFVAVRRISQGLDRGNPCHSASAEVVAGSAAWLGRGLSCVCAQRRESDARPSFDLTPAQEECLQRLQNRMDVAYDSSVPEHQEALKALWNASFPEEKLRGFISEQWKEMGWQGKDPSTDFRGGGLISLENLLYFARNFQQKIVNCIMLNSGPGGALVRIWAWALPHYLSCAMNTDHYLLTLESTGKALLLLTKYLEVGEEYGSSRVKKSFQDLLRKQVGDRAMWEYPFAVAGVNITFMLIQMLDLEAVKPRTMVGATFLKFLSENESAFDLLYCITFKLMDHQWLAMHASYMDFNTVMKATRRQLERELLQEDITRLEDLPSYALLRR